MTPWEDWTLLKRSSTKAREEAPTLDSNPMPSRRAPFQLEGSTPQLARRWNLEQPTRLDPSTPSTLDSFFLLMFLKPPTGSDRPLPNRSNKGAFTNRPLPKRKAFKPLEEDGESQESKQETAFVTWVRTKKQDCDPAYGDLLAYVLKGAPFRGDCGFGLKEEVKEAGACWLPNPLYKDGDSKKVKRGWWSALDDKTLFLLLTLNKIKRKSDVWKCYDDNGDTGLLVEGECTELRNWMHEFYTEVYGEEELKKVGTRCESIVAIVEANREADEAFENACSDPMNIVHVPTSANQYRQWPGETTCSVCKSVVTDQFMDCSCSEAVWKRCSECWLKFRVDSNATADTQCGCAFD